MTKLTVGIIATHREAVDALRGQINESGLATVIGESIQGTAVNRPSARHVINADPMIIILDINDAGMSLQLLQELRAVAPKVHLFV